ncbi:hypothetical protein K4749_39225, partial [Streptomyces sp. TRM72054]|uniref:hypothetical protein n=1 Tax=Streptomyces sp. TRM72054 TaxID=2870562 RepID=UPI001C8B9F88
MEFEVSDPFLREAEVRPGAFKALLELAMLLRELVNPPFEGGVLRGESLDGFAGDHLVEVVELAHELADAVALGEDLLLRAGKFGFSVQRALAPGRFDLFMGFCGGLVALSLAGGDGLLDKVPGVLVLRSCCLFDLERWQSNAGSRSGDPAVA